MDLNKIENLLELYFEGETSLKQEAQLQEYFTSDEVAPHLEEYVPIFGAFAKAKETGFNRTLELPETKRSYKWIPVAASVLLCIGLFLTYNQKQGSENDLGTYKDPEVAALKTKQALFMMGSFMNKGTGQLEKLETFEETANQIVK
ncbi:hypothetical protein ACFSYG_15125 [Leeuwenhoekiella polynyae]|uniref:Uncharacterized protein n=1 Tax=Leeuwenhoekiella polynyae TaxID=1550906 RepID=A0A4Q0NY06_9FLAO|nr:hypothetical protein [Leeuwenhoekiella polynyae]RXG17780.1 hypothetical protein DSM02_3116 [Leeuwenhoekiella polynyae]|tara:strand:- start:16 stop:453 length:438 start_codon:yes stop_codon:yes gene_type:complete